MAVLVLALGLVGCSLFGSTTDQAANSTKTITTYNNVSQSELEENLTKYREIAESLANRITALEETVRSAIVSSNANIGAYATVYADSVINISCSGGSSACQGTGFIITADGYVLTNNHVVAYETTEEDRDVIEGYNFFTGAPVYGKKSVWHSYSSITANFDAASDYPTSSTFTLEVIYRDPSYDLALCKIVENAPIGDGWKSIPFYDGTVTRGDELLVLGNARGQGLSATRGIVSMTGKTFSDYPNLTFIQTDAAINGGNSGGPAINIYGGLIGVVNSKFVSVIKNNYYYYGSGGEIEDVEGMGFAIELAKVKEFIAAAETSSSVTVAYQTISAPASTESVAA